MKSKTIIGYRSEEVYGEGHRDIKRVILHEIETLGNSDIIDTLKKNKMIKSKKELEPFIEKLKTQGYDEVIWLCPDKQSVIDFYNV